MTTFINRTKLEVAAKIQKGILGKKKIEDLNRKQLEGLQQALAKASEEIRELEKEVFYKLYKN